MWIFYINTLAEKSQAVTLHVIPVGGFNTVVVVFTL